MMALSQVKKNYISCKGCLSTLYPKYQLLKARRDSFNKTTELDGKTGLDFSCGLAKHGFFKDENRPNWMICFQCGLSVSVRAPYSLNTLRACDIHEKFSSATNGSVCAYWEIFKPYTTTDEYIRAQLIEEKKNNVLWGESCKPIAIYFMCHNELFVTGDRRLWTTITNFNHESRAADVAINPEISVQSTSGDLGHPPSDIDGLDNCDEVNSDIDGSDNYDEVNSDIDVTDGLNRSVDAKYRGEFNGGFDSSKFLKCFKCPRILSFVRVG